VKSALLDGYRFAGGLASPPSPIECLEGRYGEGSDAQQQQRKEEAKAGQEQEERRSGLTVQTRLVVRQPIRQEALVSSPNGANDGGAIED
jgi:hypothetical protein